MVLGKTGFETLGGITGFDFLALSKGLGTGQGKEWF